VAEALSSIPGRIRSLLRRQRQRTRVALRWLVDAKGAVKHWRSRTETLVAHLTAADPRVQLKRGFAIVRGPDGGIRTRAADLLPGPGSLEMHDGKRPVRFLES
jgi:exonuclease VII large subunit